MGMLHSTFVCRYITEKDVSPDLHKPPTYDVMFGFPTGRKKREMIATQEELIAAKIPMDHRDYCAHLLLDYQKCWIKAYPYTPQCEHSKHVYLTCEYEDFVLRMKEYERERRLKKREKRIKAKCRSEMGDV
uniref:NADH dehydrogenase [ubiquinone] 1 beta subcomplex subunit 7 n=1 Tax=Strigamia maritima TaxID=126957 RepID=T1J207_STRMM